MDWKKKHCYYLYYPKQSTHLMKFLSKFQQEFSQTRSNNSKICREQQNALHSHHNLEKRKENLEASQFRASNYFTKL